MTKYLSGLLLTVLCITFSTAQNITGTVVDFETGEKLPSATIEFNGESIISNSEGSFTIYTANAENAVITVSYLGYFNTSLSVGELINNNNTVKLKPGVFELDNLNISNKIHDAESIMAAVKENLTKNHASSATEPLKSTIFFRESETYSPKQLNIKLNKSEAYKTKAEKDNANAELKEFTEKLLSNPPKEFTEMLCNNYTGIKYINNKSTLIPKFEVLKAVKIKDANRPVALEDLQKSTFKVLYKHIDSTKHYRVKSGLFGTRDTILSSKKQNKADAQSKIIYFTYRNNIFSSRFDFINKIDLYNYSLERTIPSGNDKYVYVIKFSPKKNKAKYTGTLYISETDYAVIKADYILSEGKKISGVNLKFLLGIKQSENASKGTLLFKKREFGSGYYLKYATEETGQYVYVNRPLKFIEIKKGKKESASFDLKVETNHSIKEEYLIVNQTKITEAEFDKIERTEFDYNYLQGYSADTWKEYNIIEPLEEMKNYKALEE